MMAELLYKIADIINANSKVYRAVVPEARHDYMMHENGKLVKSSCLVLRIMLSVYGNYFVIRFIFNNSDNKRIEFESLECAQTQFRKL